MEHLPANCQFILLFVIPALVMILAGSSAIINGEVRLFRHDCRGLSARAVGIGLVVVGLIAAKVAITEVVHEIG